ncbi:MAG TPA: hypothetical protein VIK91_21870 [Nannocystis sp.]
MVTVRRDDDEWRIWPAHGPSDPFAEFSTSVSVAWTDESAFDDLAKRVVAWPDSTAPEGRAYVVGYSPETRTVRGLVVEMARPDGEPLRIEIPASAFGELIETLMPWASVQDPE